MNKLIKLLFIISVILATAPVSCFAANWLVLEEKSDSVLQIDTDTVKFTGEDTDKQLEVWMKIIRKDEGGAYYVGHYLVKESGLTFILKDRTFYTPSGKAIDSFQNSTDKWSATTPITPIGSVATHLFSEYHKNPEAFNQKMPASEGQPGLSNNNKMTQENAPVVDPNEVKKALDDEQIKLGKTNGGAKNFYVRDRRGHTLFSGISHYVTADFCLAIDANSKRTAKLEFSTEDTRAGVHSEQGNLTIQIDEKEWILTAPVRMNGGGTSVKYGYTYKLPDSLIQALAVTNNPVMLKWKHRYNNSLEDHERVIPDKTLRAIQLMYLGCK